MAQCVIDPQSSLVLLLARRVNFRSLCPFFIDLLGHGTQFGTGLNPLPLKAVQLALGSNRNVLRLVPRALKGLYLSFVICHIIFRT